MRPVYESDEDRDRQKAVLDRLVEKTGLYGYELMPRLYPADALGFKHGRPHSWLEVKCRPHDYGIYDTYMLSALKVISLKQLEEVTNVKAWLVVQWSDCTGVLPISDFWSSKATLAMGGRSDRGDEMDREPCKFVPISGFAIIDRISD